jgi:hypothetical protein
MSIVSDLMSVFAEVPESQIKDSIWNDDTWAQWSDALSMSKAHVVNEWIGERWDEFMREFSRATEIDELLVVHRCITVENPEKWVENLKADKPRKVERWKGDDKIVSMKKSVGVFWTWDFKTAECHWSTGRGTQVIVTGLVGISSIDIEDTVLANFRPSTGEEEKEIRLKDGAPILITNVSLSDTDPRWRFDPPLPRKA